MTLPIRVTVNGAAQSHDVVPRLLLVHYLRDVLGLTGAHVGCDTSQCGACTVLVDGQAVKSCTVLAVQTDGAEVTTIEGLAALPSPPGRGVGGEGELHALQQAFWDQHGLQCGYCTPGMIMAAYDDPARPGGSALPLHRLPAYRRRRAAGRRPAVGAGRGRLRGRSGRPGAAGA